MLSGTSAYIKHLDPIQTASSLFLSVSVNYRNRIHHRSIQSINFNHNRGIKLLFRHDAIEKIAWRFFLSHQTSHKGCHFVFTSALYSRSLHFLEECTRQAEAVGIMGHNECILCHFKHTQDHWQKNENRKPKSLLKETEPQKNFSLPLFVALGYVSLFYGCSNFKCTFLSCEMHSLNIPGGKLEGLIDGQMWEYT